MDEIARWPHTGAILAGGRSRRMGRPKESIVLPDGSTMIERVRACVAAVCARVVIVGRTRALADLERIVEEPPGEGPLAAIGALLDRGGDEAYLVVPCDLPRLTPDVLRRLVAPQARSMAVFRVEGEHEPRPLPALVTSAARPTARALLTEGRRAVRDLVDRAGADRVALSETDAASLFNVNRPEDLV
jgi:molybdopterin-guanine dinucleotide biosynthesis protein A